MPLQYTIPAWLAERIAAGQAELIGAIIKDTVTGRILGHVQQTSVAQEAVRMVLGEVTNAGPFAPLNVVAVVQNVQIARGIADLKESVLLLQHMQVASLALSGLGLGVTVAGFAVMHARLNAIEQRLDATEERLDEILSEIRKANEDRRSDDLKTVFADVEADLQNLNILPYRADPNEVAETSRQLQLSLTRSTRQLERHFRSVADIAEHVSAPLELLERLWTLAGAMHLCQQASMQALFVANDLAAAQMFGKIEVERHFNLLKACIPDELSRLISRSKERPEEAREMRQKALKQAHILRDGVKGGLRDLAGQISLSRALQDEGKSGYDFVCDLRETEEPYQFLISASNPEPPFGPVAPEFRYFV